MSSQLCEEDVQRAARHIVREIIINNCEKKIKSLAFATYPAPEPGVNDENKDARLTQIMDKRSEVCLYVQQSYFVKRLNTKIIECLKGSSPDFIGYKTAFDGAKEALEKEGFFLVNNISLGRKN